MAMTRKLPGLQNFTNILHSFYFSVTREGYDPLVLNPKSNLDGWIGEV
jgi:hypothetical protein